MSRSKVHELQAVAAHGGSEPAGTLSPPLLSRR